MHNQGHDTDPDSLPAIATIHKDVEPPPIEYDDEPIRSNTPLLDPSVPYRYILTLPTQSSAAYGLILLSSRQVTWTVDIQETYVQTDIPNPLCDAILSHTPTVTRAAIRPTILAKDDCTIYSLAFQDLTASQCYGLFRDAAI